MNFKFCCESMGTGLVSSTFLKAHHSLGSHGVGGGGGGVGAEKICHRNFRQPPPGMVATTPMKV